MSLNSVKKMWFTEKGDEACTEFGDKKGNSQNSVMNSSQAGIAHIYGFLAISLSRSLTPVIEAPDTIWVLEVPQFARSCVPSNMCDCASYRRWGDFLRDFFWQAHPFFWPGMGPAHRARLLKKGRVFLCIVDEQNIGKRSQGVVQTNVWYGNAKGQTTSYRE